MLLLFGNLSCILLYQFSRYHDLMAASHAFQPEIRSCPQDFPLAAPAGMGLFHLNDIAYIKSVCHISFLSTTANQPQSALPEAENVHPAGHRYK